MTDAPQNVDRDPVDPVESMGSRSSAAPNQAPTQTTYARHAKRARTRSRYRRGSWARTGTRTSAKHLPIWQEMLLLLGIALVLAVVIKAFFMQAFYIPSGSMNDTLVLNDRILVQKVSYWADEPQRGDIVVFSDPGGWLGSAEVRTADSALTRGLEMFGLYPTGGHLVKRVIGVGGDRLRCCDERGRITVNGVPLNEKSYLAKGEKPSLIDFDVRVKPGHIWVQGDNRSNSADSRLHLGDPGGGQIPVDRVVGKVFMVVWPWDHTKMLETPATFDSVAAAR